MKDSIYQRSFSEEEYDEYIENTPLEARFDYTTISLAVVEGFEKHEAYGMQYEEYARKRQSLMSYDQTEKKRLSFYFPKFVARVSSDLAVLNKTHHYRFLILMIELGMITFQVDYREEFAHARDSRSDIFKAVTTEQGRKLYYQMEKMTISLNSISGSYNGGAKHMTPTVPEWLYNAINDAANYLNMTASDFTYLCWCIAVQNALPGGMVPEILNRPIFDSIQQFEFELNEYDDAIVRTIEKLNTLTR